MEVDTNTPACSGAYNLVVTAHRPTAVMKSVTGHFTSPTDTNLIIAKSTRIEIHTLCAEGLQGVLDVPIYGRVSGLELFRPEGESKDLLFILIERYKFCVLEYDPASGELITRANGDVKDSIGAPADNGQLALIDPECRAIGLHLYDGAFKVIPIEEGGSSLHEAFNLRLEELSVVDMKFLEGCSKPTVAVLYTDSRSARNIKTYEVSIKDKEFSEGPWSYQNLDPGSGLIIPVPTPLGGAIVVGESVVTYLGRAGQQFSAPIKTAIIKCYGRIDADGSRYLLSDNTGTLYLMVLAHDGSRAAGIKIELIGRSSSASSLSYLDAGVVYLGSRSGDSHLIRLHTEPPNPAEPNNYVEVLDTYSNLGPIVDFCVVDLERQGQGQIVTCSGVMDDGSLRIVRNGIGINEQATVDLGGIKGVWSLRAAWNDVYDKYLVLSFIGETRILAINADDELDEAEITGFNGDAQTLYCGNTLHGQLVQVTSSSVSVIKLAEEGGAGSILQSEWKPGAGQNINMASGSATQVVCAMGGGHLVYLELSQEGITEHSQMCLASEISCIDINPVEESNSISSSFVVVGTWSMEMLLFTLPPGPEPICKEKLGGEVIPRSVLMNVFEGIPYCLAGMGDGQLLSWRMDASSGALSDRKRIMLGTKPIQLRTFRFNGTVNAFAASDRPTIIYSSNRKLVFSNLNEDEVNFMASFNSASFPDSLAIAKESALTIGAVDEIQKLHIRTVPLGEQPRRIAHQETTKTFGVVTVKHVQGVDESFLRILDDQTFEVVASLPLAADEMCSALCSTKLGDDPTEYFIVGTSVIRDEEAEPTKGRILVLHHEGGHKVTMVAEREMKGAVYEMLPFQGRLLSTCNNKVHVYKWQARDDGAKELVAECSMLGHVVALYLAARGDFIVVGDLMRSLSLLRFRPEEGTLEVRAQDFNSTWTSAVAMLDDDHFLGAENAHNLYVVKKNSEATTDEEQGRLEVVGEYHLGEFVNRFRQGSLVMRLPDSEAAAMRTLLFTTIEGVIGVMVSLPQQLFELMSKLQDAMRKVVKGVGGFDHATWRSFSNERKTGEAKGFVDGDLLEQFLDLGAERMQQVTRLVGGGITVDELTKHVEEIARLH